MLVQTTKRRGTTGLPATRSTLLRGSALIVSCALGLRLLFALGGSQFFEQTIERAAYNPTLVAACLGVEIKRNQPGQPLTWQAVFAAQSAPMDISTAALHTQEREVHKGFTTPVPPDDMSAAPILDAIPETLPGILPSQAPPSPEPLPAHIREVTFAANGEAGKGFLYDGVSLKNDTDLSVDLKTLMTGQNPLTLPQSGAQILIIHTHGSEAFTANAEYPYTPTDTERTEDRNFNVIRLGDELASIFTEKGLSVIHDRSLYDFPTYSDSYTRALAAITAYKEQNPSLSMVIDLHRDSISAADGTIYKTVHEVDGTKMAQMMFVMGSSERGLSHPHWKKNLTVAALLQKQLETHYPGLMRPINLRKERFNEHATVGSLILEVGTSGNYLGEALASIRVFGDIIGDYLQTRVQS